MSQMWLSVLSFLSRVAEVAMDARIYVVSERHLAKCMGSVVLVIPAARLWHICVLASAFGELVLEITMGEGAGQGSSLRAYHQSLWALRS